MRISRPSFAAIDLFAGCGGLSLGLQKAGFEVRVAVEIDKTAATTYRANHPKTELINKDVCLVSSKEIADSIGGRVDLLAGCAPCQGFCSLTAKYQRHDPRNKLLLEMLRAIRDLQPTAILMENVPGLATRGKAIFDDFLAGLKDLGYSPEWAILQMADFGIPQSRRRLVLLAGKGFTIPFPDPKFSKTAEKSKRPWRTIRNAISGMKTPITLKSSWENGGPRKYNWHVVRDAQPQTLTRLGAAQPGKTWTSIDEAIRPKCHRGDYRGFTNVYGRMSWNQPAVTITGGCTTFCKGRFGHPNHKRTTISVREAAILQTFPKRYKFETDFMDAACNMIGNAVPPQFALIIAERVHARLTQYNETLAG